MAVTLVTVTGNLETLTGATPSLGRIWFKLNRPDWNLSGDIFAPEYIEAIADVGGAFSKSLQSTDDFETGATYSAILKYREPLDGKDREYTLGMFAMPAGGPWQLGDLLAVPIIAPVPADILALCQAYALAADADRIAAQAAATAAGLSEDAAAVSAAQAALYDGVWLDTQAEIEANTSLTYTAEQPGTVVAGDQVMIRQGGYTYTVLASGASIWHRMNANGVKMNVVPLNGWVHLDAFGADRAGADCTAKWQLAVNNFDNVDLSGNGVYGIATTINLNNLRRLRLRATGATIKPLTNGMTMFQSTEGSEITNNSYGQSFEDFLIDGTGTTGVKVFDLYRFVRYGSGMQNITLESVETGAHFRELCYSALVINLDCFNVLYPVIVDQVAGALEFLHPRIDMNGLAGVGIDIKAYAGATGFENVATKISGGAVEGGTIGIRDAGFGTVVEGTYFERNTDADISLVAGSSYFSARATSHIASIGAAAFKGRSADSAMISHPFMSSGARQGLFDFDGTNTNCYYDAIFGAGSKNLPLGVVTGILLPLAVPSPIGSVTPNTGAFTTLSAIGTSTLAKVRANIFSQSIATATPTTAFTMAESASIGLYSVYAYIGFSGGPSDYTSFADVMWDGSGGRIVANNGTSLALTLSGGNVQVAQTSGSNQTVFVVWSRIG